MPYPATPELAGAADLSIGLPGVHRLGPAAGIGLIAFFVGAILVHVRARVLHSVAFPGGHLPLAVAGAGFFMGEP
ncbi:DoxX family protein [Streptomyces sp. cmx-18-6]|uniref:DoxX family protein n=1 Tax=Streptomyces sp. cmx-18-6 TaxID=2790930 RepID=UPI00397EC8DB